MTEDDLVSTDRQREIPDRRLARFDPVDPDLGPGMGVEIDPALRLDVQRSFFTLF